MQRSRHQPPSASHARPPRRRCAIYTRVSVDEKRLDSAGILRGRKEDTSLRMQEQMCRTYVAQRAMDGYMVQEVYQDDGFSAKTLKRPALMRMIAAIDAGEIDAVIIYKIDRLTRSVADFYELAKPWLEREMPIVSASQSFDTGSIGGRLLLNVLLTFAQFERELGSERTRDTRTLRVMDGKFVGGEIPVGFRVVKPGELEIDEAQARTIRHIFEMAADGLSPNEISAQLRERGEVKSSRRSGASRPWTSTTVRQVIENPRYRGVQVLDDREYPQRHGAVVNEGLWKLANSNLPEVAPAIRPAADKFMLVGRANCGICGQPLAGYEATGRSASYAYYTCRRARKNHGGRMCPLGHLRVEHLDHLVFEALSVLGRHPALCRATAEAMHPRNSPIVAKHKLEASEIQPRIDQIEAALPTIQDVVNNKARPALAERMMDEMEALLSEKKKLSEKKHILDARISFEGERYANVEAVAKALEGLPRVLAALPEAQRRELFGALVQRVLVKPYDGEKVGFEDGAVVIAPLVGTRRYLVKISIYEKCLLSEAFTNSVDGSLLERNGCPGWDRTSDQVINSHLLCH